MTSVNTCRITEEKRVYVFEEVVGESGLGSSASNCNETTPSDVFRFNVVVLKEIS